jgi:hypothetical protein
MFGSALRADYKAAAAEAVESVEEVQVYKHLSAEMFCDVSAGESGHGLWARLLEAGRDVLLRSAARTIIVTTKRAPAKYGGHTGRLTDRCDKNDQ